MLFNLSYVDFVIFINIYIYKIMFLSVYFFIITEIN